MFDELFAPGRKHTRDEQNRLELTREDVGDADPGHGPIDLASGTVVASCDRPNRRPPMRQRPTRLRPRSPAADGRPRAREAPQLDLASGTVVVVRPPEPAPPDAAAPDPAPPEEPGG
ncbi:DUF6191 domain-containing protein [Streptomyces sp. ID05-47C]|uniref:DUF6191 domain-containing protein n=1 Tax=Streptomyces sp. ID05-47C TaxID=3028665 RepID=UPI0039F44C46